MSLCLIKCIYAYQKQSCPFIPSTEQDHSQTTSAIINMQAERLFDVKGKVVLVTGGGRGVGEMIAAGYVANGAKVSVSASAARSDEAMGRRIQVYISSRTASACEKTASELTASGKASGGSCIALPADLAKYDECLRIVKELEQREGKLDILVRLRLPALTCKQASCSWA